MEILLTEIYSDPDWLLYVNDKGGVTSLLAADNKVINGKLHGFAEEMTRAEAERRFSSKTLEIAAAYDKWVQPKH